MDKKGPEFLISPGIADELKTLATYYHDLKATSDEIANTLEGTQLTVEQEKVFGAFNANISRIMEVFFSTIDNLNLNEKDGEDGKVDQLSKSKEAYGDIPGYYLRKFRQLTRRYPVVI